MRWVCFVVASLVVVGCSSSTPATTPTSVATTSTTTTTTLATTTTVDRITEIEAIYQDLEERRLDALYRGDEEAYRALFANAAYMEASLVLFDVVDFLDDWQPIDVVVMEIVHDSTDCMAVQTATDYTAVFVDGEIGDTIEVLERLDRSEIEWGISFVGKGWTCEGTHPFDS